MLLVPISQPAYLETLAFSLWLIHFLASDRREMLMNVLASHSLLILLVYFCFPLCPYASTGDTDFADQAQQHHGAAEDRLVASGSRDGLDKRSPVGGTPQQHDDNAWRLESRKKLQLVLVDSSSKTHPAGLTAHLASQAAMRDLIEREWAAYRFVRSKLSPHGFEVVRSAASRVSRDRARIYDASTMHRADFERIYWDAYGRLVGPGHQLSPARADAVREQAKQTVKREDIITLAWLARADRGLDGPELPPHAQRSPEQTFR